jgi:hypothetical protein
VTGGYGLEIGYLNGRHFFYLDVVPTFVWSEISWQQNGAEKTVTRTGLSSQAEIGYTYNWRSDWLIKIFSRSQAEQTEIWKDALSSRLGAIQYPVSASTQVAGLTIAYQFESFELEDRRSRR